MATAEELLAATGETSDTITLDLDSRRMAIPEAAVTIGVASDDDVRRLYFVVPRHYREIDLSEFDIRINFKNGAGTEDQYPVPVDSIEVDGESDQINFSWLLDRSVFEKAGDVKFSICMVKYGAGGVIDKEFNSTPAILKVLEGLETAEAIVENNPSAFDNVLFRLKAVENAVGLGVTGYYNIIDVKMEGEVPTMTIANHDGTIEYFIKDGEDGHTPVKGVDYYTEEDKSEIQDAVIDYVDAWAPVTTTVTLLAANWVDNQQTVDISAVKEDSLVIAGPELVESNHIVYVDSDIQCVAQSYGQLTFSCVNAPDVDVLVNVCIHNSNDWHDESPETAKQYIDEQIDTRLKTLPASINGVIRDDTVIMTLATANGGTIEHVVTFGEDGYPSSLMVDGVAIPLTFTVESTTE